MRAVFTLPRMKAHKFRLVISQLQEMARVTTNIRMRVGLDEWTVLDEINLNDEGLYK